MKIAVCIKQVPGTTAVEIDPATGIMKRDGVESKMNPFDLFALETALRLKEEYGGEITVFTMGPPQAQKVLREAFMMGCDHAVLLSDRKFGGADVLATGYTLAQGILASGEKFDLIVCGKQTTDGDTAQVGAELSEFLKIPCAANVCRITGADEKGLSLEMDLPEYIEHLTVQFPCLITVDKGIFEPRLPSYLRKKATADRPVRTLTQADLKDTDPMHYGINGSATRVVRIFPPEHDVRHEVWNGTGGELAEKLFQDLKKRKFLQQMR